MFVDCKIPRDNLLGEENPSAEKKGIKGAMATFDLTRPGVAAMAARRRSGSRSVSRPSDVGGRRPAAFEGARCISDRADRQDP